MNAGSDDDRDAAELREFLAENSWPCPTCEFDLRGNVSGSCPECGRRLPWPLPVVEIRHSAIVALSIIPSAIAAVMTPCLAGYSIWSMFATFGLAMGHLIIGSATATRLDRCDVATRATVAACAWIFWVAWFVTWAQVY